MILINLVVVLVAVLVTAAVAAAVVMAESARSVTPGIHRALG